MKRVVQVFPRRIWRSDDDGSILLYNHPKELCDILGQAKSIRLHVLGYFVSEATQTQGSLTAYESSFPEKAPSSTALVKVAASTFTTLTPAVIDVSAPFMGRIEIVLGIEEADTPDTLQEFELEVWATLGMD